MLCCEGRRYSKLGQRTALDPPAEKLHETASCSCYPYASELASGDIKIGYQCWWDLWSVPTKAEISLRTVKIFLFSDGEGNINQDRVMGMGVSLNYEIDFGRGSCFNSERMGLYRTSKYIRNVHLHDQLQTIAPLRNLRLVNCY